MFLCGVAACCYAFCCASRNSCAKKLSYSAASFAALPLLINFVYNLIQSDALKLLDDAPVGLSVKKNVFLILIPFSLLLLVCVTSCMACDPEKDEEYDREQVYGYQQVQQNPYPAYGYGYGGYQHVPQEQAPLHVDLQASSSQFAPAMTTTETTTVTQENGFAAPMMV